MNQNSSPSPFFPDPLDNHHPKPKFPFDDDYRDESEDYEEKCPNCWSFYAQHSSLEGIKCAFEISKNSLRGDHPKG